MRGSTDAISPAVALRPAEIVRRFGPHACARAGLDPCADASAWLALALLLASGADETRARNALRALPPPDDADPHAEAAAVATALARERIPRAERLAATLVRARRAFAERWGGSLERLASDADDLETLGARIATLAPGVGRATVLRFLRPLRERFVAAREVPLAPAAHAAALHAGLLSDGEDEEGEPAALRHRLAHDPDAPPFADLEAALERLGAASCLRGRVSRCPLGAECPVSGPKAFD
jgi:hypothetical protein